ncbi:MAG: hypothetical protein MZV70_48755 [Desulfobacterales bacterium]|nr:hypothetical protein [Desulfobacterales bacterium]
MAAVSVGDHPVFQETRQIMVACLGIVLIFTMTPSMKGRFTDMESIIARLSTYFITYEVIKDYPVMGIGFGMETYGNGKHIDLLAYSKRFLKNTGSISTRILIPCRSASPCGPVWSGSSCSFTYCLHLDQDGLDLDQTGEG